MSASTQTPRPTAAAFPPIPFHRRIYGFGSVYGKTIRDSRLAFIIAAGLLGGMALLMGAALPTIFPNSAARHEVDAIIGAIPTSMVNIFGKPVGIGTLGGYMTWKYGAMFVMGTALWSVMALSGTLAAEARHGSLDMLATVPLGKRRLAVEKVAAHLTMLWLAMLVLAVCATVGSQVFGEAGLGDTIAPLSGLGFGLWIGSIAMFFGGLAFLLAPVVGRGASAGITSLVMVVLWLSNGLEGLDVIAVISPFRWTADHIALVAQYDWPPVILTLVLGVVFLAGGVALFVRRDVGVTVGLSTPGLPGLLLGTRGAFGRAFADQLPRALAWGIGLGLMGALLASLVGPMAESIRADSQFLATFSMIFPNFDLDSAGGWIQLYAEMLYIAFGFAAATLVSKWASDETDGRLEMLLASPLSRVRWLVAGGVGALVGSAIVSLLFAVGILSGAASGGVDAKNPMIGSAATMLFAWAVVGVGVAVGGLWRASLAGDVAALFVVATYLLALIAPPLGLPDWVSSLALTTHYGEPMTGSWDMAGVVASLVIALGGITLGAWGVRRRDVAR